MIPLFRRSIDICESSRACDDRMDDDDDNDDREEMSRVIYLSIVRIDSLERFLFSYDSIDIHNIFLCVCLPNG